MLKYYLEDFCPSLILSYVHWIWIKNLILEMDKNPLQKGKGEEMGL